MQFYKRIAFYMSMGIMGIGLISFSTTRQRVEAGSDNESGIQSVAASGEIDESQVAGKISQEDLSASLDTLKNLVATPTPTPTSTPTPTPLPPNDLEKDKYPEINTLVANYYNAKLECVAEGFEDLVTDASAIDVNKLMLKTEYIKSYENMTCYTKWIDTEIDYVVYVSYDIKFPTIDTLGASLDELYVKIDDDGNPRVYLGVLSDYTEIILDEYRQEEDVVALIDTTREEVTRAIQEDESLADFYQKLAQIDAQ